MRNKFLWPSFSDPNPIYLQGIDETSINQWIEAVERFFEQEASPMPEKLEYVIDKISGPARKWYISFTMNRNHFYALTWEDLKDAVINEFCSNQIVVEKSKDDLISINDILDRFEENIDKALKSVLKHFELDEETIDLIDKCADEIVLLVDSSKDESNYSTKEENEEKTCEDKPDEMKSVLTAELLLLNVIEESSVDTNYSDRSSTPIFNFVNIVLHIKPNNQFLEVDVSTTIAFEISLKPCVPTKPPEVTKESTRFIMHFHQIKHRRRIKRKNYISMCFRSDMLSG